MGRPRRMSGVAIGVGRSPDERVWPPKMSRAHGRALICGGGPMGLNERGKSGNRGNGGEIWRVAGNRGGDPTYKKKVDRQVVFFHSLTRSFGPL